MKKVLVIAAHPDDEVLGMGGTIAKMVASGAVVDLLVVTDGSTAQYRDSNKIFDIIKEKKAETRASCDILGIREVFYGNLPDMKLDVTPHIQVNGVIEKAIEMLKPDTVFTHFWGDLNMDHQCVYRSTLVAVRPIAEQCVKEIFCYSVPSSTEWMPNVSSVTFMPNVYVDINEFAEQKYRAFSCYKTELRPFPHPRSVEYLRRGDCTNGLQVGLACSERFVQLRRFL